VVVPVMQRGGWEPKNRGGKKRVTSVKKRFYPSGIKGRREKRVPIKKLGNGIGKMGIISREKKTEQKDSNFIDAKERPGPETQSPLSREGEG